MTTNDDRTKLQLPDGKLPEGKNLDTTEKANNLGIILTSIVVDAIVVGVTVVTIQAIENIGPSIIQRPSIISGLISVDTGVGGHMVNFIEGIVFLIIILITILDIGTYIQLGVREIYSGKRRR